MSFNWYGASIFNYRTIKLSNAIVNIIFEIGLQFNPFLTFWVFFSANQQLSLTNVLK
ncbi:hypothetical protein BH11BAC1_BH11BAC1_00270 [soil metagenome]